MDDMKQFEQRFEDRVRAFALTGVRPVDAAAVAHAVAVGQPRDRRAGSSVRWRGLQLDRRVWTIAVALGLLVALLGGAVLVGARLLLQPPFELSPAITNGWIAFTVRQPAPDGQDDDTDIWLAALEEPARRVIGTDTRQRRSAVSCLLAGWPKPRLRAGGGPSAPNTTLTASPSLRPTGTRHSWSPRWPTTAPSPIGSPSTSATGSRRPAPSGPPTASRWRSG